MAIADHQTSELYCVIPRELAEKRDALGAALAPHGIAVIVERRDLDARTPYEVRRQRAKHLPRRLPDLPEVAEAGGGAPMEVVQRMPAPGLTFADSYLEEVVDAAVAGDAVAASELVWRMHPRVSARLSRHQGAVEATAKTDLVMGLMLDELPEFRWGPGGEASFLHWLDRLTDSVD